jgi:two-component system, NarL family, response regulator
MTIRILLAEDNQLVRMGVASLVRAAGDMELVGEAVDGVQAVALYRRHQPDVVVTDLKMPSMNGIQVTSALMRETPPGRVLILTQFEGDESIHGALRAGALGYVTKETPGEQILEAIRLVATGRRHIPPAIGERLAQRASMPELTVREQQVLQLIFEGQSNKDIAQTLQISDRTVGVHVSALLGKMSVKSRTEAVAAALRRGLLESK